MAQNRKTSQVKQRKTPARRTAANASAGSCEEILATIQQALGRLRDGDFSVRLPSRRTGLYGDVAKRFNEVATLLDETTIELQRVGRLVGREGRMSERITLSHLHGGWSERMATINSLVDDLARPTREVARVMEAVSRGDLSQKIPLQIEGQPVKGEFFWTGTMVNSMVDQLSSFAAEVSRVAKEVGTDGKLGGQAKVKNASGTWKVLTDNVNFMASNLTAQVRDIAQVATAVAKGDLSQKITVEVRGEILELKDTINTMVDQLRSFADEVTRVAREVGTDGKLGGQGEVKGVSGTWKDLTDSVNFMASNLTGQVRNIAQVATAVAKGDLSQKITVDVKGEILQLKDTLNTMVDQLRSFADEVTRVAREVGTEGRLGGQAEVPGVAGVWKGLTDNVNSMASNLTDQVRNIAQVATAVAKGDLSQKITVDVKGEILELKDTLNTMVDQLRSFADEVTRVAREVGTQGRLGGQAEVPGVAGVWKGLTDNVNSMASNLTAQVRDIAQVTTAVATGDLSQKITVDVKGEILELKNTINTMVDQLSSFADEVTRVAREVGTDGKLGGQAQVKGVSGTWKDLTDNVNFMASNLTGQVRNIAQVTTAVAKGDLSQKITVDVKGEILELKDTINTMVDQLSSFADEVTRVAREVGTDGKLGGQAQVKGVSGTWKDLTDNVNFMASNLTGQVRNIAQVATAVAGGDLSQKITVDVKGEILELKNTINTMVDQLSSFADEVTRVAREVGTEGKLGGQAEVEGVAGTWRRLTEGVNQLASNLTTQVRAIAEVATAVTEGDHSRTIQVGAQGEVADLKNNINQMIANLRETTQKNAEQDWLKTNLARISGMLQGQRDLRVASSLIMSEVTPVVNAQRGAFYMTEALDGAEPALRLIATYAFDARKAASNRFRFGEGLIGQAALERKPILLADAPPDYIKITSGLGESAPLNIIALPLVFEDQVLGVIELASLHPFSDISRMFLEQTAETIAVVLNSIVASMRTEELLMESQRMASELQTGQEELKQKNAELEEQTRSLRESEELLHTQQDQLQKSNAELEEKAELLAEQNRAIESKNQEIEVARRRLEEKAHQLTLASRYKSEFLANMSHELRTPLNSLLILAQMLAANPGENLTAKQIEFAETIHEAGANLLELINEILDLSKVEAGKLDVSPSTFSVEAFRDSVGQSFRSLAEQKGLAFEIQMGSGCPEAITTDERRLQQIINNLLSNAFKFTTEGGVILRVDAAAVGLRFTNPDLMDASSVVAFTVSDTGIGIPPDKLELIFEPFQQADGTTSRRFGGTGLGLSISREIGRMLGGEIHVESAPDEGSTFTLYLPGPLTEPSELLAEPADGTTGQMEGAPAPPDSSDRFADDRGQVRAGDRVVVLASADQSILDLGRSISHASEFKTLIAPTGEEAITLVRGSDPSGIILERSLAGHNGLAILDYLKREPRLRHIPVYVVADLADRAALLAAGAAGIIPVPATRTAIKAAVRGIRKLSEREARSVLAVALDGIASLLTETLSVDGIEVSVVSPSQAVEALGRTAHDCVIIDGNVGSESLSSLATALRRAPKPIPPCIVYVMGDMQAEERAILSDLRKHAPVREALSAEELLFIATLFLHWPTTRLSDERRAIVDKRMLADPLKGKSVLIVDDDVRNVFALASALESAGMNTSFAENGREAIEMLSLNPQLDLVLMDIMMPEMDGYEAMRTIRAIPRLAHLPLIALTAKAMKGDREKAIAAGASDYIAKPIEIARLLSLLRVWIRG